jgi:bifunctional non-homologous end joining protein LigD
MKKSISPMLATLIEKPFDDKEWIFEIKWDGYRALAEKAGDVHLVSRNHKDFHQFPSIVEELKKISGKWILDGEVVILDKKGRSDFQLLQNYQRKKVHPPVYYVFDILFFQGKDLRHLTLMERRKILKELLKKARLKSVKFSEHIEERGKAFFQVAKKKGLEGIMAKRKESLYRSTRTREWLKIKTGMRQEVVIGGFTKPRGSRSYLGALLVGVYKKGKFVYAGHVGGGFDQEGLKEMYQMLKKVITEKCPFLEEPHPNMPVTWVKPTLVCEVKFAEWTTDGMLRQPVFLGIRVDKSAKQVVRE